MAVAPWPISRSWQSLKSRSRWCRFYRLRSENTRKPLGKSLNGLTRFVAALPRNPGWLPGRRARMVDPP